jgi:hypothetical protein
MALYVLDAGKCGEHVAGTLSVIEYGVGRSLWRIVSTPPQNAPTQLAMASN